tara:strand:- start:6986 stop:7147 length:162 start_codon:yes stop_codon:yes gene_type:complete
MKKFTIGLLSAAALVTTILLVRQDKEEPSTPKSNSLGETQVPVSLERIRELGL